MKTILVTGGNGYIGSHAILHLISKKYNVVSIDNLSNSFINKISGVHYYIGDFSDKKLIQKIFKKHNIDAIMHFAGSIYVGESVKKPSLYKNNNTTKTSKLIKLAEDNGIKYFIFSSTAATYGVPKIIPISEKSIQKPINPYGHSKLNTELELKKSNLKYVIFRYFNVAGASNSGKIGYNTKAAPAHIIPILSETILGKRDRFTIFGDDYKTKDGTAVRDYVHVDDLVDAHIKGLEYLFKTNKSNDFNLGSGKGYSNLEIIKAAEKIIKHKINYELGPRRAGDPDILITKNAKAKKILKWSPKNKISSIISSDLKWRKKLNKL